MNKLTNRISGIAIAKNTKLNKGQLALYDLLVQAYETKSVITKKDIQSVYKFNVEKNDGQYWNSWKERIEHKGQVTFNGGYEPKEKWRFEMDSMNWFTRSLGSLIKKGYLTVLPRFNLKQAKELAQ